MSGTAGAVLGLLSLHALLDDSAPLDLAIRHGEALISGAERANGSLSWRSPGLPDAPGLTGFSHGAAGVAVALLELDEATGARRYRDAAAGAFHTSAPCRPRRAQLARPARRHAGQVPTDAGFASFWCHGAPGGALARLRALNSAVMPSSEKKLVRRFRQPRSGSQPRSQPEVSTTRSATDCPVTPRSCGKDATYFAPTPRH